ncbi:hypothetical protein B0A55_11304 [Friedmanniomyces simplex]|uniref:BTB domain-containing protein n=1 Tax=Friedmanniomyces simplex TaxID=329884 RepID=A0A4U0W6W9_9PEZI|nr:hypothetical protein B0A55_11304 [Friedmanniomyces simplex]
MSGPADVLKQGFVELYRSGELTDFVIECGQHKLRVHKVLICAHSKYFRAPCGKDYAEGEEGRIVLKAVGEGDDDEACDDPEAIKLMVDFFYYLDYSAGSIPSTPASTPATGAANVTPGIPAKAPVNAPRSLFQFDEPQSLFGSPNTLAGQTKRPSGSGFGGFVASTPRPIAPHTLAPSLFGPPAHARPDTSPKTSAPAPATDGNVIMHAKVFAAAVKYQVPAMQKLSASKFVAAAKSRWDHPAFAEAARIAYTTTMDDFRQLRDIVSSTLHEHRVLLDMASIESVVKGTPDLHFELLRLARGLPAVAEKKATDEGLKCAECGIWLWYEKCETCSAEYTGCCGSFEGDDCARS